MGGVSVNRRLGTGQRDYAGTLKGKWRFAEQFFSGFGNYITHGRVDLARSGDFHNNYFTPAAHARVTAALSILFAWVDKGF